MNNYKASIQGLTIAFCLIALGYSNDLFTNIVIGITGLYISYLNWREN